MPKEQILSTQQLIGNLVKVGHKALEPYTEDGLKVVDQDPNLFAHLIAWNQINGEIRDSKVAYPILSLRGKPGDQAMFYENAVAHLLLLDPRNLVRACMFHRSIKVGVVGIGGGKLMKEGISKYLQVREGNVGWWDRTVLQHRDSMKTLYTLYHVKPNPRAQHVLFDKNYPKNSVFEVLRNLSKMESKEAAGTILNYKIPFLMAIGALGGAKKNSDVLLALIESMTGTELITNSKMLTKLGVMDNPALKAAYNNGLVKAQKDKKVPSMKADRAKDFVEDEKVKAKLEKLQETKLDDIKGLEGDWLVLGDRSGSMSASIDKAKEVAGFLTRVVKGKVYLGFFNTLASIGDFTGKTLEEIRHSTRGIWAGGGTSIGCGLQLMIEKGLIVNGVVIVSDGGENNHPQYAQVLNFYEKKFGFKPNTYLIHLPGEYDTLSGSMENSPYQKIEGKDLDFYGLPNLAKLLKSGRYTLIDEIMESKLLTIKEVLDGNKTARA